LAPAIRMAEEGVPTQELHAWAWSKSENLIKNASPSAHDMLADGKAPLASHIFKFPHLANTFKAVAEHGTKGFYTGRIAEAIVELVQSKGGVMTMEDLANHTAEVVEPIKYEFRKGEAAEAGVTLYEVISVCSCIPLSFAAKVPEHLVSP
jgi:gamma-glutamyltranspeptidase/glutathione hydrolase